MIKKSHRKGAIPHEVMWGKKYMPTGVYDSDINVIEMKKGDVLFFNSYLLHTSNINFSEKIRYSLQMRFTTQAFGKPSKNMGEIYDL